jgi:hypothetical protein
MQWYDTDPFVLSFLYNKISLLFHLYFELPGFGLLLLCRNYVDQGAVASKVWNDAEQQHWPFPLAYSYICISINV